MSTKNSDPQYDGQPLTYYPTVKNYRNKAKFYYVNGILTDPKGHRFIAELIANITQSRVRGIYNASGGALADLTQCVGDWIHIVRGQLGEEGFFRDRLSQSAINTLAGLDMTTNAASPFLHAMREAYIAPASIKAKNKTHQEMRKGLKRNKAALGLFDELTGNLDSTQIVVAHSQGNLITSFALWGIQAVYGSSGLRKIQIRSVSSPSPSWPRGINYQIKVYGQRDDPVTWFDPKNWTGNRSAGFWENFFPKEPGKYVKTGGIAAHSADYNIEQTSLYRRLRDDAGVARF